MNLRSVIRQLGLLTVLLSVALLGVFLWSVLDWTRHDPQHGEQIACAALAATMLGGLGIGWGLWWFGRSKEAESFMGRREALLLVAASWLFGAALAAMPFWLWGLFSGVPSPFQSWVNCYFEAMSGLTTTGASILSDIEALPKGLLMWRALTQWLGGLGIVVLFVAVLPSVGVGGKKMFQIEAPGPTQQGVKPRIAETARVLWIIYLTLSIGETLILRLCGMSWFNSVAHTLTTLATGGFSTSNSGMGDSALASPTIQVVIIGFMVLAGVNFGIYYQLIRRRFRSAWTDPELRLYVIIMLIGSVLVTLGIFNAPIVATDGVESLHASFGETVRHSVFQVVSMQTTTGFATVNFEQWSFMPKAILIVLMFVGGSAGSTGGGLKVIRVLIVFKVMLAEIERVFRPNVVRTVKVGKMTIDPELRLATVVYVLGIFFLFALGTVLLMLLEQGNPILAQSGVTIDITSAATASAATLNNIGPGLALVGPMENYGWFTAPSKLLMCLLMALGRLEMFAILVLFVPRFWRGE